MKKWKEDEVKGADNIYIVLLNGKLRLNIFALCALLMVMYLENVSSVLILTSAAMIHECGHFIAIKANGCSITRVDLEPFGATIAFNAADASYKSEMLIALGGPIAGIAAAGAGWLCFLYFPSPLLLMFVLASMLFSLINLFPLRTLDGGTALRAFMLSRYDIDKAELILRLMSLTAAAMLCVLSAMLLQYTGYNVSLLALTGFQIALIFSEIISGGEYRMQKKVA